MLRPLPAVLLAALLPACATITTGTSSSIAVTSDPAGASCQLRRNGELVAAVGQTPQTITISKSSRDLAVNCTRDGHRPGASVVRSEFQPMVLGNILIGGLIGLAVDAGSGAVATYPQSVTVVLAPERFDGAAERDAHYNLRAEETRRGFEERIAAVRRNCTPGAPAVCADQVRQVERERDAALEALDAERKAAALRT